MHTDLAVAGSLTAFLSSPVDIRGSFGSVHSALQCNAFLHHYKDISNTNLPTELFPKYTIIEYTLARPSVVPPISCCSGPGGMEWPFQSERSL